MRPLWLHEELVLLALREKEGTFVPSMLGVAAGGGLAAELLLNGRIRLEGERSLVTLVSNKKFRNRNLDRCLELLETAHRRAALQNWVSRFMSIGGLGHLISEDLCRLGVLREDEKRILWLFRKRIYPEVNPAPENKLVERLRVAIFTDTPDVDPRTVVLISLARATGLLEVPFDKSRLEKRKDRIDRLVNGELLGKVSREIVASIQAMLAVSAATAVMVATMTIR